MAAGFCVWGCVIGKGGHGECESGDGVGFSEV